MPETFLSEAWFAAVEELRKDQPAADGAAADLTINIVVTGGPEGDTEAHMKGGVFDRGLTDDAPTKLTVPYDIAKAVFIEGNQQAAMQAFMGGQIKVEGDMSKLMAMQAGGAGAPSADQAAFQQKLKDLTV